jgi:hypothetical protein
MHGRRYAGCHGFGMHGSGSSMSMHEFEALVEQSIIFLDKIEDLDHRSLFNSLYNFEAKFDTGFTRFRAMDRLLKRRFAYRVSLEDHPQYAQFQRELDAIREEDFAFIYRNPSREWNRADNPLACYWKSPYLYFEAGSDIWKQMVDAGRLTGPDAIDPVLIDPVDIVSILLNPTLACGEYGLELLSWWYFAIPWALGFEITSRKWATAKEDQILRAVRDGVIRSEAYRIHGPFTDAVLSDEAFSESSPGQLEFMKWWFPPSLVPAAVKTNL